VYFKCIIIINNDDNLIAENILSRRFQISNNILITILHFFKFELRGIITHKRTANKHAARMDVEDIFIILVIYGMVCNLPVCMYVLRCKCLFSDTLLTCDKFSYNATSCYMRNSLWDYYRRDLTFNISVHETARHFFPPDSFISCKNASIKSIFIKI